jgi:hypothetical protein
MGTSFYSTTMRWSAGANAPQRRLQGWRQGPFQLAVARPPGPDPLHVDDLPPVAGQFVDLFHKGGCVHCEAIVPRKAYSLKCSTDPRSAAGKRA